MLACRTAVQQTENVCRTEKKNAGHKNRALLCAITGLLEFTFISHTLLIAVKISQSLIISSSPKNTFYVIFLIIIFSPDMLSGKQRKFGGYFENLQVLSNRLAGFVKNEV